MAVYSDGTHLVADTLEELHAFAALIGRKRCWFDASAKYPLEYRHPHYDLHSGHALMYDQTHYWARRALQYGAIKTSPYKIPGISNRCARLAALQKALKLKIKI